MAKQGKKVEATAAAPANLLYYGDNLDILRNHVCDESVDLVYLDPPFKSSQDYNILFREHNGTRAAAQIKAFGDTWRWDAGAVRDYREVVEQGGKVSQAMQALRLILGDNDMLAYLTRMAPRLVELRRVMKTTGSLYLHCDPTASHYLKVLLDAVFGPASFRNEITWQRTNAHNDAKRWADVADTILYYGRTNRVTWNVPRVPYNEDYIRSKYRHDDGDGRGAYRLSDMTSPHPRPNMTYEWLGFPPPMSGWRYSQQTMQKLHGERRIWYPESKAKRPQLKRYLLEMKGTVQGSVWTDIPPLNSQAAERLGYQTQKPEALLERIMAASSNKGDTILDPFCGCGTTISVAQRLERRWIGIDITHLAITLIRGRLKDAFGASSAGAYKVAGEPASLFDAVALAESDRFQFQWWALSLVGACPAPPEQKKGKDKGIDGRLYFHDEPEGGKTKQVIFSVKSGGGNKAADVRDLVGVVTREQAAIGVLISLEETTKDMRTEAAEAGDYISPWGGLKCPKIQLLTIEDLFGGSKVVLPSCEVSPFKKAPKAKPPKGIQQRFFQ